MTVGIEQSLTSETGDRARRVFKCGRGNSERGILFCADCPGAKPAKLAKPAKHKTVAE
jgi:hypothetical protein